jgi:hypothetical protein
MVAATLQCFGPAAALCLLRSLSAAVLLQTRAELLSWDRHVSLVSARVADGN